MVGETAWWVKALATQAKGTEFDSPKHMFKKRNLTIPIIPALGRQRWEDPGVLLASQSSQISKPGVQREPAQKTRWEVTEADTQ